MNTRSIVHFDLDSFFVSVERLIRPELKGKPVVVGSFSKRGVVASCSYEARKYGIHSAMPGIKARQLCPHAIFLRGNMQRYSYYSAMVTKIIAEESPVFEKASIDEFYIDITGMDRFYSSPEWTAHLRNRIIHETGLPISCGLSINKTLAKMATNEAKPNGMRYVPAQEVSNFLAPLSIQKIPMIGPKSYEKLKAMGIHIIADLRSIPMDSMEKLFGKYGQVIGQKARGIYDSPVIPYRDPKSVGKERTFHENISNTDFLRQILVELVEKAGYELRRKNKLAGLVSVKIRYSDFDTHNLQKNISFTSYDHVLLRVAEELFDRLYKKNKPVRLIGVRFGNLANQAGQLDLFEDRKPYATLYTTLDEIKNRYGKTAIQRAVGFNKDIH